MTRLEKCEILKSKGYKYDPETGKIFNRYGKEIKRKTKSGYICINGSTHFSGALMAHHFAWYMIYGGDVDFERLDHKNRIKTDNCISNLRILTNQQNCFNTNAKGCCWRKDQQKWQSYICFDYKQIHLGYFNTEEDARQAYLQAKEKYHII